MLEKLTLKNFQKHESFSLDLSHPVVTIVGSSDRGKSSILRALQWLSLGTATKKKGSQVKVTTFGKDFTKVKLQVDGKTITRRKGGNEQGYDLDGKKFFATGNEVPEEISKVLNLGEESFQNQFDAHYWVSLTPGEVAKELNRIVDLSLIDSTMSNLAQGHRKAKTTVEVSKERLATAKEERNRLAWTVDADAELNGIEELNESIVQGEQEALELAELIDKGKTYREQAQNAVDASLGAMVADIEGDLEGLEGMKRGVSVLETLIVQIKQAEADECRLLNSSIKLKNQVETAMGERCPLCLKPA